MAKPEMSHPKYAAVRPEHTILAEQGGGGQPRNRSFMGSANLLNEWPLSNPKFVALNG